MTESKKSDAVPSVLNLDGLWKRPELSPRDRNIVTVAALIARIQTIEMAFHFSLALNNGVKAVELSEIITHLAFYSGWAPDGAHRGRRSSVGSRTGAVLLRSGLSVSPRFLWECLISRAVNPFQSPPRRTQRADFPHWAHLFASCQELCDLSCWSDFRAGPSTKLVVVKQPQPLIEPLATPPLPGKAIAPPGTYQMFPDLHFYPLLDL